MDAAGVALHRPVGDGLFDEARVGHQDIDVVVGADACGARADLHDGAANADVLDLDIIADRYHPVENQEQAGDKLLDHALQTQTHADAQRAGEDGQGRQVQPCRRQGRHDAHRDDAVAGQPLQQIDRLTAAVRALAHPAQRPRHQPMGGEGDQQDHARADQTAQRQIDPGDAGDLRLLNGVEVQLLDRIGHCVLERPTNGQGSGPRWRSPRSRNAHPARRRCARRRPRATWWWCPRRFRGFRGLRRGCRCR